jgi:tryptophanyl-tRNA synthetase
VADAVIAVLAPLQDRYREITADPGGVDAVLADGARRAAERAAPTLAAAKAAMGLLP